MKRVIPGVLAAVLLGSSFLVAPGCSDGDGSHPTPTTNRSVAGVSEQEAIEIATAAWLQVEPTFDVTATRPSVLQTADTFDVAFVPVPLEGPGGEPHVVVDRSSGTVLDTYRTK